jgi:hypothetical protein
MDFEGMSTEEGGISRGVMSRKFAGGHFPSDQHTRRQVSERALKRRVYRGSA